MNLLLLDERELGPDGVACLQGRRRLHAREVLRAAAGDVLRVGVLDGRVGVAEVLDSPDDELRLRVTLEAPPPERPGIDVLLAVPRPKALKKVLPALASLGVDRVVLVNAARVERSYFDSSVLAPAAIDELLRLGAEQARDTRLPQVATRTRLRPFVEDELDAHFGPGRRLLAHPDVERRIDSLPSRRPGERELIAIGPEGGWVPFELELLVRQGFVPVSAGPRPLRVEVAVPYLLGALLGR